MIAPAWLLLSLFPLLGCLLSVRFLLRKWRYRWTAWLWGLTFCIQLLFFFGQEAGNQLIAFTWDPFEAWARYASSLRSWAAAVAGCSRQ
jgi:hypothetical protein